MLDSFLAARDVKYDFFVASVAVSAFGEDLDNNEDLVTSIDTRCRCIGWLFGSLAGMLLVVSKFDIVLSETWKQWLTIYIITHSSRKHHPRVTKRAQKKHTHRDKRKITHASPEPRKKLEHYLHLPGIGLLNDPFCCMTLLAIEWSLLQRRCSNRCNEDG